MAALKTMVGWSIYKAGNRKEFWKFDHTKTCLATSLTRVDLANYVQAVLSAEKSVTHMHTHTYTHTQLDLKLNTHCYYMPQ